MYKGRKKQTIQYDAVKSVSKARKPRVLQEVRAMHALAHPSVLAFHAWYETANHLWLVLEYCVGGDLLGHRLPRPIVVAEHIAEVIVHRARHGSGRNPA